MLHRSASEESSFSSTISVSGLFCRGASWPLPLHVVGCTAPFEPEAEGFFLGALFSRSSRQFSSSLGSGETAQIDGYRKEPMDVFRLSLSPTSQSDSETSPADRGGEFSFCEGIGDSVLTLQSLGGGAGGTLDLCVSVLAMEQVSLPVSLAFCDRKLFKLKFPMVSMDVCEPLSPAAAKLPSSASSPNLPGVCLIRPLSVCIEV